MSELKITEFRTRAEHGLDMPDLEDIERRGRAAHRRRVAAVATALALVVLAGSGIARLATDGTDASPAPAAPSAPTRSPSPTTPADQAGVRTTLDLGEVVLRPGPSKVVYGGIAVHFDVPSGGWEWWDTGMGLRRRPDDPDNYGAAVFFLRASSARLQPCSDYRVESLGSDPDRLVANVDPLLHLAHATVLQGPRVVPAFGGRAVHLRLETKGACPDSIGNPAQLGSMDDPRGPGWGGPYVLDVWNVLVPGPEPTSMLVASWDLDGTERHRALRQALLDSVRIGVD